MTVQELETEILKLAHATTRPFYVYSGEKIKRNAAALKEALGTDIELFYSLKANSHPTAVAIIRECGLRADVASKGELEVALQSGFTGSDIEFTGPGKTLEELELAVLSNVAAIVIESSQELIELERICRRIGKKISAHVRLNPRTKLNYAGRTVIDEPTQFGVDNDELVHFIATLRSCHCVTIVGTHCHVQSQTLSPDHVIQNFQFAAEAADEFAAASGAKLEFVNLGGGFGIAYSPAQEPLNLSVFASKFKIFLQETKKRPALATAKFRVELGRAVVGDAGHFITRVLYTKSSRGKKFAITDGGFTQGQIMAGVGQLIRRNFAIRVVKRESASNELITIAGPSCYGLDILANEVELPHLDPGDLICIDNVGAYGYSFSPVGFLRQQSADEYFI